MSLTSAKSTGGGSPQQPSSGSSGAPCVAAWENPNCPRSQGPSGHILQHVMPCLGSAPLSSQGAGELPTSCRQRAHPSSSVRSGGDCVSDTLPPVTVHSQQNPGRVNRKSPSCDPQTSRGKHVIGPQHQVSTDSDTENPESLFTKTRNRKPLLYA